MYDLSSLELEQLRHELEDAFDADVENFNRAESSWEQFFYYARVHGAYNRYLDFLFLFLVYERGSRSLMHELRWLLQRFEAFLLSPVEGSVASASDEPDLD